MSLARGARRFYGTLFASAICLFAALPLMASAPFAAVTGADAFLLDGRPVAVFSDVASLPLRPGNEIETVNAPVVLYFADGSSVRLGAGSRARLTGSEERPKLLLLAGALDYKLVLGSKLSVTTLDLERESKPVERTAAPAPKPMPRDVAQPRDALLSVVTR